MEQSGSIESLNVFGGGSKSDIWCQTIADITNKTVKIMDSPEQACRGAAILAGLGCSIYDNIEQISSFNMEVKKYIPDGVASTLSCDSCRGSNVIFEEGCNSCKDCGHSGCS